MLRESFEKSLVVRIEGEEEEEIWTARVLFLCRCFVEEGTKGMEVAIVQ